jgi:hypothetical protein
LNERTINLEEVVGRQVLLMLKPDAFSQLKIEGLNSPKFYATVSGYDSFGVWVKDERYCITPAYDSEGNFIPATERREECHVAHILIQWSFILSMIYIPGRQGVTGVPDDEARMGFLGRH